MSEVSFRLALGDCTVGAGAGVEPGILGRGASAWLGSNQETETTQWFEQRKFKKELLTGDWRYGELTKGEKREL